MIMILNNFSYWSIVGFISLNRLGVIGYSRAITFNGRRKNGLVFYVIFSVFYVAFVRRGSDFYYVDVFFYDLVFL